jgi:hypothetical protein
MSAADGPIGDRLASLDVKLERVPRTHDHLAVESPFGLEGTLLVGSIPHGTADEIAAVAREHLDASADHVCLQSVGVSGISREEWTALASALIR